jgi:ribonuclease P protein component
LTTSAEFQALFHRGKRIDRPSFLVLWAEAGPARRVGFAVSRQLKRAVDRNRIRRRLREAYRAARGAAPAAAVMVVVGKKRVLDMKFEALVAELEGAFATMGASQPPTGFPK